MDSSVANRPRTKFHALVIGVWIVNAVVFTLCVWLAWACSDFIGPSWWAIVEVAGLFIMGVVWLLLTLAAVKFRPKPWSWLNWMASPMLVLATFVLIVTGAASTIRFSFDRPFFDRYVVSSYPAKPPLRIGTRRVSTIYTMGGATYFHLDEDGFLNWCVLFHHPNGTPPRQHRQVGAYRHLSGDWYVYEYNF